MEDYENAFWVTMCGWMLIILFIILANFGWLGVLTFATTFDFTTKIMCRSR